MRIEAVRRYLEEHGPDPNDPTAWRGIQELFSGLRREMFSPLPEIKAALVIAKAASDKSMAFALMKAYIGHEPTPLMKTRLAGELPNADKWVIPWAAAFLRHHKRRLDLRDLADRTKEDVAKVRPGFRMYGRHRFALDALRRGGDPEQGQVQGRDEMLAHFIRVERAEDPAATTEELRGRVSKGIGDESGQETVVMGPKTRAKLAGLYGGDDEHDLAAFVDRENARQEIEALRRDAGRAGLAESERKSFGLLLDGMTVTEAARARGRTKAQVSRDRRRALERIEEYRRAAGQ